ncbi:MAG: L,D-transpeptidase [Prevotella sp.]|nr:L,D-transpeptidase [Prevotella sp.]
MMIFHKFSTLLLLLSLVFAYSCSCGKGNNDADTSAEGDTTATSPKEAVGTSDPRARLFTDKKIDKKKTFIVISKKELCLSVYGEEQGETILVARYPVCISKNKGQKQENGDMRTPESEPGEPFTITEIKDASTWCHDFGDSRGSILAYGKWFLRLSCGNGIGIHGSTNNRWSVPGSGEVVPEGKTLGRDSEGCIRLLDEDIIHLHDNFAHIDMPVIIKQETQGALDFEKKIKKSHGKLIHNETADQSATASKQSTCSSEEIDNYKSSSTNE